MNAAIDWMLRVLALPEYGLGTLFLISFISATLLPLGSEPAVFGLVKLNPPLFWPAILVATAGGTLGGALTWWTGLSAERAYEHLTHRRADGRALKWLGKHGAKACLLSWLPIVGDPLCAVAGWLAGAAVLALRRLHGDRQVRALPRGHRRADVVLPRSIHPMNDASRVRMP